MAKVSLRREPQGAKRPALLSPVCDARVRRALGAIYQAHCGIQAGISTIERGGDALALLDRQSAALREAQQQLWTATGIRPSFAPEAGSPWAGLGQTVRRAG
jgi:hypothetical protein